MDAETKEFEKRLSRSEYEEEELDHELSRTQKKAAIRALKRTYGPDWKQQLKDTLRKGLKTNRDVLEAFHGINPNLRSYNDPRTLRSPR